MKLLPWIFTSPKVFSPDVNSTFECFRVSVMNFMTFNIFGQRRFLFGEEGAFWISLVLPLVIYLGIVVSSWHIPNRRASLSWVSVNFSKPESVYAIIDWYFPVQYIFPSCSERFICIIASVSCSSPYNFSLLLFNSAFLLRFSRSYILLQNFFASFTSVCWYVLVHLPVGIIFFRYFGKSCFGCISWPCLSIF